MPSNTTELYNDFMHHLSGEGRLSSPRHLTLSDHALRHNARMYPEMDGELDPLLVEEARNRLMEMPLVHRTDSPRLSPYPVSETTLYDTPTPSSDLPIDHPTNTYSFDQEHGLDEYVFMRWGAIYPKGKDGFLKGSRFAVLLDPKLLLDEQCFVTPTDVASLVSNTTLHGGRSIEDRVRMSKRQRQKDRIKDHEDTKAFIHDYIGKAVYGSDWLDIQARRLVIRAQKQGKPLDELSISSDDLGEIKFKGPVPASAIIGTMDTRDSEEYKAYVEHIKKASGFIIARTGRLGRRPH